MNLVNVAIENLGAKIKTYSSFIDDLHQPSNILQTSEYSLWATGEGLPQFVIVSLQDLNVKYKKITQVGFMLWHDYDTNPKTVELWVAETTDQDFMFWGEFTLDQKKGIQLFGIRSLPERFIYLKISITQTYGAFETYLNQVFFMAEGMQAIKTQKKIKDTVIKKKKQLDLEDLQSNLKQLVQIDRRISHNKSNRKKQQKVFDKKIRDNESSLVQETNRRKRNQISKGSSSGNRGFSIYYHEASHLADDESIDYVSNDYESNSQKGYRREKLSLEMIEDKKRSLQESVQFLHTLQSNSIGMSPSLNLNSNSGSFSIHKDKLQGGSKHANKQKQSIKRNLYQLKKRKTSSESQFDGGEVVEEEESESENGDMEEGQNLEVGQQFSIQMVRNTPKYNQLELTNSPEQPSSINQHYHQQSSSYQKPNYFNTAISTLSKQVGKLEDNMDAIQRKVDVLDMKVAHSHKKMHQDLLEKVETKVEQIVDRKLKKIWSSNNVLKSFKENKYDEDKPEKGKHINDKKQSKRIQNNTYTDEINYKKNLTKEFFKSDYNDQQQKFSHLRDKTKTKRRKNEIQQQERNEKDNFQENYDQRLDDKNMNRLKTSKSYAHIMRQDNRVRRQQVQVTRKQGAQQEKKGPNQEYIAKLLERLNMKLKQRQTKLSKIQKKEKKNCLKDNQQLEMSIKVGKHQKRRVVTNNYEY